MEFKKQWALNIALFVSPNPSIKPVTHTFWGWQGTVLGPPTLQNSPVMYYEGQEHGCSHYKSSHEAILSARRCDQLRYHGKCVVHNPVVLPLLLQMKCLLLFLNFVIMYADLISSFAPAALRGASPGSLLGPLKYLTPCMRILARKQQQVKSRKLFPASLLKWKNKCHQDVLWFCHWHHATLEKLQNSHPLKSRCLVSWEIKNVGKYDQIWQNNF